MRLKRHIAIRALGLIVGAILACSIALAQDAAQGAPPSLEEQLQAEYRLVKLGPGVSGPAVLEPGTVLVIQKDGIFGVPHASAALCASRYQNGKVDSPEVLCPAAAKGNSRSFKVGEKGYASKLAVNLKNEQITFAIIACDACNGPNPTTSSKSQVIFQFAKGYLEKASVPEVEDTIGEVLAVDNTSAAQSQPAPAETAEANPALLTNGMVIRMARAKLGDAVILDKIRTSQCDFNTSTDALIDLKQAGVSDAVLQAMIAAAGAPAAEPAPAQPPEPSPGEALGGQPSSPNAPDCSDYNTCLNNGRAALQGYNWPLALTDFQAASSMDASKPDAWEELGKTYLATGHYEDAAAMWDKALGLGGTLSLEVWHYKSGGYETGNFRLGAKQVSFVRTDQQILFSVVPTEVSSVKSHHPVLIRMACEFDMKAGGRKYLFFYVPSAMQCASPSRCSGPSGYNQEEAVANYVAQTIPKLASGALSPAK
jgi:hypothetical protein